MNLIVKKLLIFTFVMAFTVNLLAQSQVTGTVKDANTQKAIPYVSIVVVGTTVGTVTDINGQYTLKINQAPPFTISFSYVGYSTEKVEVTNNMTTLNMSMVEEAILSQGIVVSSSRMKENIMKAPVTIEKLDILAIKQAATADYYDVLANMKGVQVTSFGSPYVGQIYYMSLVFDGLLN